MKLHSRISTFVLVVVLSACGGSEPDAAGWFFEVALEAPAKLGGCAVGDVDPAHPGNEIVAVSIDGSVYLVSHGDEGWTHEVIGTAGGELIQVAIGDVDPAADGNEVVAVGMSEGTEDDGGPGAVHVFSRGADGWSGRRIFEDGALIHGVCVADLDPDRPGTEILVVGFTDRAILLFREGDGWRSEVVANLESAGKNAIPFDGGAAVATSGGLLLHVKKVPGDWTNRILDRAPAGLARLGTDGERILAARDDGALGLWTDGERTDIYSEGQKLRGAALGDFDPDAPGLEAATVGYEMRMTVLTRDGDAWRPEAVFTDTGRFHHLASGELLEKGRGLELVACGYSQRLVVVGRE